jgi:putative oxidoreductase
MHTSDRIIALLLALVFFASGAAKLAGLEFEIAAFEGWGYPLWFMYAVGLVEVIGAVLLVLRHTSALAAAGLAAFMIGAVGTHVLHAEWGMLVVASTILLLAARHAWRGWGRGQPSSYATFAQDA